MIRNIVVGKTLQLPKCDPFALLRYRDRVYGSSLLGAAIAELDFFSRLAERPMSLKAICASLRLAERPVDVMITLFSAMGLIHQVRGKYSVTKLARDFLVSKSPFFLGPYFASIVDRPDCQDLLTVLRTGKPIGLPGVTARVVRSPPDSRQISLPCRLIHSRTSRLCGKLIL